MTAVRGAAALVDGDQKALGAVDPLAFEQLVDIDVQEGDFQALADGGIFVHKDPAKDLDLQIGDPVDADVPERHRARRCPSPASTPTPRSPATG